MANPGMADRKAVTAEAVAAAKAATMSDTAVTAPTMATTAMGRRHCAGCHCCGADDDRSNDCKHFLCHGNHSIVRLASNAVRDDTEGPVATVGAV